MSRAVASKDADAREVADASEIQRLLAEDLVPWYKKPNLRRLYFFLVPAALGVEMTSGYDGSVLNGLQAVDPWLEHFSHPSGALLGIVTASFNIGAVSGIPFIPWLNDRYGRKACVVFGSILISIGVVIQTAAINVGMLIASRLIMGMGIPYAISGASQLIAELSYPHQRAVIIGLFNESWYVGAILAAGVTLGTFERPDHWSWRLPTLFQILPSTLQLAFIWFVPESPRWLVARDRHEEALAVLTKYHAEGDPDSAFVAAEFHQIRETIRREAAASKYPWKELITNKVNRRRVLIAACVGLFAQWAGNGLVSYYLAKVLASIGISSRRVQNQLNLGLMCWNLVTGIGGSFAQGFFPRRKQFLTAYGGMCLVFACWTAASATYAKDNTNHSAGTAVVALIFVYYSFYNLMMPLAYCYITEVFPYVQRSKGVAIVLMRAIVYGSRSATLMFRVAPQSQDCMQLFSRAGSAFNQFVNPIGLDGIGWRFYLVYVIWLAVETSVIFLLYPETKGPSLEEVAMVMDKNAEVETLERGAMEKAAGMGEVREVEKA